MPALRRKRTSTPYATPTDTPVNGSDARKEKVQKSLDAWVEPAPQNPTPSFEEHGFARHGVLETMAPLGVPPSAKVKQRARVLGESNGRRFFFGKGGNMFPGDEGVSTPEMTPAPELEREYSERQEDDDIQATFPTQDEDEDDDYIPKKSKAKPHATRTPVRGKTPVQSKTHVHGKTPVKNGMSKNPIAFSSPAEQSAALLPDLDEASQQRIQIAVNDAISRANKYNKRSIGVALRQMFDQGRKDSRLAKTLNAVIHQKQSSEEWGHFRQFIKAAKKKFRREERARQEQETQEAAEARAAQETSRSAGHTEMTSPKTSSEIAPNDSASATHDQESAPPSKKLVDSATEDAAPLAESPVDSEPAPGAPHPLTTAPTLPPAESPSPPASRMPSKSPRKQRATNGDVTLESEQDANLEASTTAPTPLVKTPDSGQASESDLSDVNEEIVQAGPPPPAQANGKTTAAQSKRARNAALARAGKKSRANSMKPFGKHEKKAPLTAEEIAEQEEIQQKRQAMAEQQPYRMPFDPPTSDIRFDDEILETESLTESQIAVGPPIDSNRPRRAGRAPRNGMIVQTGATKRLREDDSRFPSPQLDSAGTTRPSTPAALTAERAPKRLKLNNGQAARTKRSPVKNRDGPIAGIPHAGGGGSRQSGPDDNDPGSPPSESDDLCAACKGAGEFVCCDNCPRVFHFLCCDPPRLEAPEGSFLCYECTAKLKPTEESVAESHPHLGPLFKTLERINTRAFALPFDIQNHFENVSARADGCYFEDVKRFPLAKSSGYGYQKPDYTKILDADHKPILCTQCGVGSGGKRQMLKCDFCHAYWHLDCCAPPLANPPHISLEATQRDAWRCPRHIEHDLRSGLMVQNDLNQARDDIEMVDAPAARVTRKVRKPKKPEIVEPTFSRGMRNNGLIEIINDADDDTDGEGNYVFSPDESKDLNSKVYRVPEKGLILDFIGKVKSSRIQKNIEVRKAAKAAARRKSSIQHFAARPIQQQQAALNLARLANKEMDIGLTETSIDALILSLTAEAPADVISAISDAPPPPVLADERAQLLKLQELINRRLKG